MRIKSKREGLIYIIIIFLFITILLPINVFAASKDPRLLELEQKNVPAFNEYNGLKQMKDIALLSFYGVDRRNIHPTDGRYLDNINSFIDNFNKIHLMAKESDPNKHFSAINDAINLRATIEGIGGGSTLAKEYNIQPYALTSLELLLKKQGTYFEKLADETEVTQTKVDYLKKAEIAYKESDSTIEALRMASLAEKEEQEYARDMTSADSWSKEANEIRMSIDRASGFFDYPSALLSAKRGVGLYIDAISLYQKHNELETASYTSQLKTEIEEYIPIFQREIIKFLTTFGTLFIIIFTLIAKTVFSWKKDVDDTKLGEALVK